MTPIIRFFIITVLFVSSISSFDIPLSYKYEMSIGYDDNFMRFSNFEIDSYDNQNAYLGDAKTYDSAILSGRFFKISFIAWFSLRIFSLFVIVFGVISPIIDSSKSCRSDILIIFSVFNPSKSDKTIDIVVTV